MAKNTTKVAAKATEETTNEGGVKVTSICKKHGMNPKHVRAKLRRIYRNPENDGKYPKQLVPGTWTFAEKDRKRVEDMVLSFAKGDDNEGEDD
jgi:hypothetical protein